MAERLPMPRIILKRRPSSRNDSPGLSSVPASIEPIITEDAPAASAFTMSPEYLMPPSAITGTSPAPSMASSTAVSCGTPTPVTTRVVQMEPGPTPTFTALTPRSTIAGCDVPCDQLYLREHLPHGSRRPEHRFGVSVRGIHHERVHSSRDERGGALAHVAAGTDRRGHAQPSVLILVRRGKLPALVDVLHRDESTQL